MRKITLYVAIFMSLFIFRTAIAFDINGEYVYKAKGCSGGMEVLEKTFGMDPHVIVKIDTACSEQYHTCSLTAKGQRQVSSDQSITATFASVDEQSSGTPAKFTIEFRPNGANIDISAKGDFCGLNGWYGGKYLRKGSNQDSKTKKDSSIKAGIIECKEAFGRKDWNAVASLCTDSAKQGNPEAQFNLGIAYFNLENNEEGVKWIQESASNGNVSGKHVLSRCYANGWGVNKNVPKAMEILTGLINSGYKSVFEDIEKLAKENPVAQNTLGSLYETGNGVPQDYSLALKWYRKAAEEGNIDAINSIQRMAENNIAIAQYNLAEMYQKGIGVQENIPLAQKWSKKCMESGSQECKDLFVNLALDEFIYASDVRALKNLMKNIEDNCQDLKCAFDSIWKYIDISKDDKLSLAEIARFQRNLVKLAFAEEKKDEVDRGEMVAVNLGGILILPVTASAVVNSFDYNNDGLLSKNEVMSDREFATLVGININQIQKGINFDKVGENAEELMKDIPLPR